MTSRQHPDLPGAPAAATARDAAVRRMSRINRLAIGGSLVMVAGFATLAAQASTPGAATTATTPSSGTSTSQASSSGTSAWQSSSAQTSAPAAPAPTQQAPVVTSGGS